MSMAEHRARKQKRSLIVVGAAIALVIALGVAWLVMNLSKDSGNQVHEYSIRGLEYTTNLQIEEVRGEIYVYVLVNTDTDDIVFEVEDAADNGLVSEFFKGLDTFIPGEYEVELTDSTLRVIVDGMVEE